MGDNYGKKTYAPVDICQQIDFQTYVDSVKQKTTTWYIFENFMKDLTYSSVPKLKLLNAVLLIELTTDYSDIDRLKYLNSILMAEFKELIEKEENSLNTENEYYEESQNSVVLSDSTEEIIKEESESEIIQIPEDELKEDIDITSTNVKLFSCQFCNKRYGINFHLKQHIKNIHEEKNKVAQILNEEEINETTSNIELQTSIESKNKEPEELYSSHDEEDKCGSKDESSSKEGNLKKHFHKKANKDYRCDSCEKLFSRAELFCPKFHFFRSQTVH